jgi:DnaJ-class molecular chaperone
MSYYDILGISKDSSDEQIKKAYRKLAMLHHPDRNQGKKTSEEKFKKINEAYATLSDKNKRSTYDFTLRKSSPFNNFNDTKFNEPNFNEFNKDSFEQQFTDSFFRQGSPFEDIFSQFAQRKQIFDVEIDFWEGAFGIQKSFEFNIPLKNTVQKHTITVNFPPGTNTGDLFNIKIQNIVVQLRVSVAEHFQFRRENLDLYTNIEIPMTTALLGGNIEFLHWEKSLDINIPEGIKQGQMIRLANLGITKDMFQGDLYLVCNIILPNNLTKRQREILQEFQLLEEQQKRTFGSNFKDIWKKFFTKKEGAK